MRKINKIIIHCTDTPGGEHFTVEDIDRWHKERGFNCIGYHFVIYIDGSVHKGRNLSQPGAHCKGHNSTSIGICYVGGKGPKDTRTDAQKKSIIRLVNELKQVFPQATVHGHNEFSDKSCPCFDVQKEFNNK